MFGILKRKLYEADVNILLMAMFGAGERGLSASELVKNITKDGWSNIIKEGLTLGRSAELTAVSLTCIIHKLAIAELDVDEIDKMRAAILKNDHSKPPGYLNIIFYSALVVTSLDEKKLKNFSKSLWFRDIHRAIFADDDTHLDTTVLYLITGGSNLRKIGE